MTSKETRVRTARGALVVKSGHVMLERGPLRRCVRRLPRDEITHIRLTSRFHGLPLFLGALLLVLAGILTLAGANLDAAPLLAAIRYSLILVLVVAGLFLVLALPLSWRAELSLATKEDTIRVRTGYNRRARLEEAYARLNDDTPPPGDLVDARLNTPSGSPSGSG